MKKIIPFISLILFLLTIISCNGENTSNEPDLSEFLNIYALGSEIDRETVPEGGIVMMGGRTENDNAMRWFLNQANGGDVLVLRTSGSDGYQDYLFSELGVSVNSVTTLLFKSKFEDEYVVSEIEKAEAIWFAGGNQQTYLDYWKDNTIEAALQEAVERNVVIGGTSAGMAILGEYIWDGEKIQTDFLNIPYMENIITDTHYDSRNRMERHLEFINTINGKGIAAEDYTAVVIQPNGKAYVYGDEAEEDNAFFVNNDLSYTKVKGTPSGAFAIDLTDW